MAMMIPRVQQGTRLSPGVYQRPNGTTYQSANGRLPAKRRPDVPVKTQPITPVMSPPLTAPPIPPLNTTPLTNAVPPVTAPIDPAIPNTLFPSTRMFEPENYGGSPLYKFQVKSGQDQLTKSLAARGLSNSGKAIQEELDIPLRAAAQDTDRMTRVAAENADRLKSFQDNEALRLERAGNNQWDRLYSTASLMAQQSPWAAALSGLNNSADLTKQSGDAQANFLRDAYQRIIASGGGGGGRSGGGGGSAATPTPIPLPTGPDYTNISPTQIGGDYSSNSGWLNLLTQGLGSLFGSDKPAAQPNSYKLVPA